MCRNFGPCNADNHLVCNLIRDPRGKRLFLMPLNGHWLQALSRNCKVPQSLDRTESLYFMLYKFCPGFIK